MQIGHLDRMRNDGDGAAILFQSGHREADAFDRDRAFEDCVLLDVVRKFDVQPPVLRFIDALEADQLADAIHMSLNDVATKSPIGLHRQLKIYQRTFVNARERSAHPGLRREISAERTRFDVECGQTYSTYGYAVAGVKLPGRAIRGYRDAPILSPLLDARNASNFL